MDRPQMKAVFLDGPRRMEVRTVPPSSIPTGEVLIRIVYCGICGSDLSLFKGGSVMGSVVLGHEMAAVVEDDPTGEWPSGTRVAVFPAVGCGDCVWCRAGQPRHCLSPDRHSRWGGYAQYAVYPAGNLLPIPDQVDDRSASLADPLGVAIRAVELSTPEEGAWAYVAGLGPIGLAAVSALVDAGCRVVAGEIRPDRVSLGLGLGCEEVIDPRHRDPVDVGLAADPRGFRYVFECAGVPDSLQQAFYACGPQGTVVILGIPTMPVLLLPLVVREQRALAVAGPSRESMDAALDHLARRPAVAEMITGIVPLEETGAAMEALTTGGGGTKVLVDPWAE